MPSAATGIVFTNGLAQNRYLTNTMLLNGSGVAAGDVDGDGLCDLYFCSLDGPNALYRNLGHWRFSNITAQAGVAMPGLDATGAALVDLDGDRDLDLIVNSLAGGTHGWLNDGQGRFARGGNSPWNFGKAGTSLALADTDGDGDLDLYVANYRTWTIRDQPGSKLLIHTVNGKPTVSQVNGRPVSEPDLVGRFTVGSTGGFEEHGESDSFLRNEGAGKFVPVPFTGGNFLDENGRPLSAPPFDWGLSVMMRDFTGDRAPDIYVCNDFDSPDRIWINRGNGTFQAIARAAIRVTSIFSMGVDVADINRDGFDDLFVVDMLSPDHSRRHIQIGDMKPVVHPIGDLAFRPQYSRNTLFLNRGDNTWAEIGIFSRVFASEWSWTPLFLDVDLDGLEDLLISTGHELDMMNADVTEHAEGIKREKSLSPREQLDLRKMFVRFALPKMAFRNLGNLNFEPANEAWNFNTRSVAHGMALADLDNDGDLDVAVNNLNDAAEVFRNNVAAPRLAVRLAGLPPNTAGIGARITVQNGTMASQAQEIMAGGRYLSSDDSVRMFAAGTNEMTIEVKWRSGRHSRVPSVRANRIYQIDERAATPPPTNPPPPAPLFEEVAGFEHLHHEEPFDDFGRQPLLPQRLSQLGPGIAWHDIDADGWDDLIIGSGRGGRLAIFRNQGAGTLQRFSSPLLDRPASRDQTGVVGAGSTVFVGAANYEDASTNGGSIRIYDLQRNAAGEGVLGPQSSSGPLALADIDDDGDLDLFLGGRVVARRYPEPAISMLLRNDQGKFIVAQQWDRLGLVSGAVFTDFTGDGMPDLVLACDWGPVRAFHNERGGFREVTAAAGLSGFTGKWNGITSGDFDGDGRLDLVASNWGWNQKSCPTNSAPRRLHFADLDHDGRLDTIESYFDAGTRRELPERGYRAVSMALPFVMGKIRTYEAYGRASIQEIFGESLAGAEVVEVNTAASMVFLNRGGRFDAMPLPLEAQFAPAFGVSAADLDGDGREDIFLSQNFFAVNPEAWRHDAGAGLCLLGDGQGRFTALSSRQSGISVHGEQRGAAFADFDHDARVDFAVSQNGAATKVYRNRTARQGIRVRLAGGRQNAAAIGTLIRLLYSDGAGPVREIHAGSGYWSQDSAVAVLGKRAEPDRLWVRWPGGQTNVVALVPGQTEVAVEQKGD